MPVPDTRGSGRRLTRAPPCPSAPTVHGLLFGDPLGTMPAWTGVPAVQAVCAGYAFRLDGESLRPLWALPLQQVLHRQLMYPVLAQACLTAASGHRLPRQRLKRSGDVVLPPQPSAREP